MGSCLSSRKDQNVVEVNEAVKNDIEKKDANENLAQDVEKTKDDAQNDSPKEDVKYLQTDAEKAKQGENKAQENDTTAVEEEYSSPA